MLFQVKECAGLMERYGLIEWPEVHSLLLRSMRLLLLPLCLAWESVGESILASIL